MRKIKNLKHIFVIIILSLLSISGLIWIFSAEFQNSINGFFIYRTTGGVWQDYFHRHQLSPSSNIALIAIDERTLNDLQAKSDQKMLTIPKSVYIDLIEKLEGAGVQGIAFDIVFQNPDPDEKKFAGMIQKYKNIVIGTSIERKAGKSACVTDQTSGSVTCEGFPRLEYTAIPWGFVNITSFFSEKTGELQDWIEASKGNQGAYSRTIKIDINTDDAKKGFKSTAGAWKNNLALPTEIYALPIALGIMIDNSYLQKPELQKNTILNPYFGKPDSYPKYSMIDILGSTGGLVDQLKGKYIIIGESGTMIHDSVISPVTGTEMDGFELHAHFLDGLLQNKMLSKTSDQMMIIITLFLTIFSVILYFILPKYLSPIVAIVVMIAIIWSSRYLYDSGRTLVDVFPLFLAGGILTFPMTFIYRFFVVDREKRYIENAFGHYIDPKMVEMINMEEVKMVLGGEQRDLSVFFSDIAGFTTISEQLSPQDLFHLMSLYLSRMTDILKHEGGTLDKYIGDAVMGFFGAPVSQVDHAIRACRTAIAMRKALPKFNTEITARGMLPVDFRVGIASGTVIVGNIGSQDHFNYTVLGDTVNLASRLEATGKEYHVHIIISEGTRTQIDNQFALRELDTIAVKGKTEGIKIYELIGFAGEDGETGVYKTYETALALYRNGQYLDAGKLWESQMTLDPPSDVMANRCVEILQGKLQVENGIYHMTHK